ncbi:MAG TPA: hypothetical protein VLE97_09670 [Gaiellaceae bacterium]|nr:hypothetical protein [Gaiellaceae bacterium]
MTKPKAKLSRGQYVKQLVNEGAGMTGLQIGVVTQAGHRQITVCWESGHRSRYPQGSGLQLMDWADWSADERREVTDKIFQHCGI